MKDFRFISFFWERSLLSESKFFQTWTAWWNSKFPFPLLSHLTHQAEYKKGFKILNTIFMFNIKASKMVNYTHFSDLQNFNFDKNYFFVWNYWTGAVSKYNWFVKFNALDRISELRRQLFLPKILMTSDRNWDLDPFTKVYTRIYNFSIFPDNLFQSGNLNNYMDSCVGGYNKFFKGSYNFMDSLELLELLRFNSTFVYWTYYENIAEDFSYYHQPYIQNNLATYRVPLIILLHKNFYNLWDCNRFIYNFNKFFSFNKISTYRNYLKSSIIVPLSKLERLEKFWDELPPQNQAYGQERLINLFFGYNKSDFFSNSPSWGNDFNDTMDFYISLSYDYSIELESEWLYKDYLKSFTKVSSDLNTKFSIYFQKNSIKTFNFNYSFFQFLKERVFDDSGYFRTLYERGEYPYGLKNFNWLGLKNLIFSESIPKFNYSWDPLYKIFSNLRFFQNYFSLEKTFLIKLNDLMLEFFNIEMKFMAGGQIYYYLNNNKHLFVVFPDNVLNNFYFRFSINFGFLSNYLNSSEVFLFVVDRTILFYWFIQLHMELPYNFLVKIVDEFFFLSMRLFEGNSLISYCGNSIKEFFYYPVLKKSYTTFNLQNFCYSTAALDYVELVNINIPLEFFFVLPKDFDYYFYNVTSFTSLSPLNTLLYSKIETFKNLDLKDLEEFFIIWSVFDFKYHEETEYFYKDFIEILNTLDFSDLKPNSLEFDWLKNFVLKKKNYKFY